MSSILLIFLSELRRCTNKEHSYTLWIYSLYCTVVLWVAVFGLVTGAPLTEDRPAMAFCQTDSKEFPQFLKAGVAGFQSVNPGSDSNSITLTDLNISIAMFKIREIELKNTQNIFIGEDSSITCSANDMKVNITFGIRDPEIILKDKPGSSGTLFVTMSLFEAYVTATLPRRDSRTIVDAINIVRMDDLNVETKTSAGVNSDMVNAFLRNIPKNVLMSMVSRYMTKATQDYIDKNPIGL